MTMPVDLRFCVYMKTYPNGHLPEVAEVEVAVSLTDK